MKFILCFLMLISAVHAQVLESSASFDTSSAVKLKNRRGEFTPPEMILGVEELNKVLFTELNSQNQDLKKVKYYLMNGDVRLARVNLAKLAYTQTKLKPVIFRYLAILSFIEGDFQKTYDYLSLKELQNIPHYGKICVLKVLTEIVLEKKRSLEGSWIKCQIDNAENFRERNIVWLETLVFLKLHPLEGATKIPLKNLRINALSNDEAKVMMKLALYLNQERLILDQIHEFEPGQLQDPEIRELAGQALFRTGSLAKSYKFIEDLKSPNSENIKGNLYLLRKKYEIAYAQFKLALEQKQNSQNAMERLLPLAWLLGDWEGGSKYAEQVIASPQTLINKMTLMAAFFMQKGDYEKSNMILNSISQRSRRGTEIEVAQLAAFTGIMQNKPDVIRKNAKISCDQYDLINCWALFQMSQWENFALTIRREDKIPERREWEKLAQAEIKQPLTEKSFVNQSDIEELDDKLIQIIPNP